MDNRKILPDYYRESKENTKGPKELLPIKLKNSLGSAIKLPRLTLPVLDSDRLILLNQYLCRYELFHNPINATIY